MKKISLLIIVLSITICTKAQEATTPKQDTSLIAFNMEQLLEKVGFDNLIKMAFDNKKSKGVEVDAKNAQARKSLAAIYGAGIDFKRKAVVYTISPGLQQYANLTSSTNMENFKMPTMLFALPIANRKVIEDNIQAIMPKLKNNDDIGFIKNGNMSYKLNGIKLTVLTDKEIVFTTLPYNFMNFTRYNDAAYLGTVVKRDTIITPVEKVEVVEKIEPKKLKPIIEIDKVVNGKVLRLYKVKPESKATAYNKGNATPKILQDEKVEEVAVAVEEAKPVTPNTKIKTKKSVKTTAKVVEVPMNEAGFEEIKAEVAAVADSVKATFGNSSDTLTTEKTINETTKEIIYYIPYTDAEREANDKKMQEEEETMNAKKAMDIMTDLDSKLPYANQHPDYKRVFESKDDIITYGTQAGGGANYFKYIFGMANMRGTSSIANATTKNLIPKTENSSMITSMNFEKGKIVAQMQAGCCGTYNELISKLYFPVTNFWPKEFATSKSVGSMRLNMNMPEMMKYYTTILPETAKEEMKRNDFSLTDFADMFTGEVALTANEIEPGKSKKTPNVLIALKIKDVTKAVAVLNKLMSQEIKMTKNYRFDETGQYLLISTSNDYFTKPKTAATATSIATLPAANNKGEFKINFGKMIASYTKESKLKKPETKSMMEFFGNLFLVNNSTEDGLFSSTMTWEMGDKNKNVLASIVELWKKMNEKK